VIGINVHGSVDVGFERVRDAFATNFDMHGDVGAACSIYLDGRPIVDLWGGTRTSTGGEAS
jgi:hypothetical protein